MDSSQGHSRHARVGQTIRYQLSDMIHRDLKDPRLADVALISVNHVDLNRDMSVARVYVGFPGTSDARARAAIRALRAGAGRLRGPLARRMNLARAPEIRFELDTGEKFGAWITEVVREDEDRAHQAGREPGQADPDPGPESDSGPDPESDSGPDPESDPGPDPEPDPDPGDDR